MNCDNHRISNLCERGWDTGGSDFCRPVLAGTGRAQGCATRAERSSTGNRDSLKRAANDGQSTLVDFRPVKGSSRMRGGLLVRLYEKLMGIPHQKRNADMVRHAVSGLKEDVSSISKRLQEYQESDDPLVALMLDMFNTREMVNEAKTPLENSGASENDELR